MAKSITITLERDLPDAMAAFAKAKAGKAMAREADRIDFAARRKNVTQPTSLLSENPAVLAEQMAAEGFDPTRMRLPPERWFTAAEGLIVMRALIEHITANLNDFKQPNPILRDLKALEAVLVAADAAGVRFHLAQVNT
jgi:hypothetical protein